MAAIRWRFVKQNLEKIRYDYRIFFFVWEALRQVEENIFCDF